MTALALESAGNDFISKSARGTSPHFMGLSWAGSGISPKARNSSATLKAHMRVAL